MTFPSSLFDMCEQSDAVLRRWTSAAESSMSVLYYVPRCTACRYHASLWPLLQVRSALSSPIGRRFVARLPLDQEHLRRTSRRASPSSPVSFLQSVSVPSSRCAGKTEDGNIPVNGSTVEECWLAVQRPSCSATKTARAQAVSLPTC